MEIVWHSCSPQRRRDREKRKPVTEATYNNFEWVTSFSGGDWESLHTTAARCFTSHSFLKRGNRKAALKLTWHLKDSLPEGTWAPLKSAGRSFSSPMRTNLSFLASAWSSHHYKHRIHERKSFRERWCSLQETRHLRLSFQGRVEPLFTHNLTTLSSFCECCQKHMY